MSTCYNSLKILIFFQKVIDLEFKCNLFYSAILFIILSIFIHLGGGNNQKNRDYYFTLLCNTNSFFWNRKWEREGGWSIIIKYFAMKNKTNNITHNLFFFFSVNSEACYLPPLPGKCDAKFTRWYFNRHSKQCSWFHYGGCGGNENRFRTKDECEKTCKGARTIIAAIDEKRSNNNYHQEEIEEDSDGRMEIATPRLLPLEANTRVVTVPNIVKTRRNWLKKKKRICGKNCTRGLINRRRSHKSRRNYRKNSPGLTRRRKPNMTPKTPIAIRMAPSVSRTYNDDRIGANRFLPGGASVHRLFSLLQPPFGSASWRRYRSWTTFNLQ